MEKPFTAKAEIAIRVPVSRVWEALTRPELIQQYLFGTNAISDWKVGSPIVYRGIWQGKPYEDKGTILELVPKVRLVSSYWSAFSGLTDTPENYQTVAYDLIPQGTNTNLTVTQANIPSQESADQLSKNWQTVLGNLKKFLETGSVMSESA